MKIIYARQGVSGHSEVQIRIRSKKIEHREKIR